MAQFKPFELQGTPLEDQFMSWHSVVKAPYDKNAVDAHTRTRVILMNGIENHSTLASHCITRLIDNDEIKRVLGGIRRADSMHQLIINWLNPASQSVLETTIAYEQVAVDLTANLAKNEPDGYFKQVLDYALIEDFDHLFRYGCLLEILEGKDPSTITQGKTEVKPGRPTSMEHRHPNDEMRKHYDKDTATAKTKMNYHTIVAAEQQTMLFYKSHGFMYANDMARKLYAEIAQIEQQHVSQYELIGDPNESPLEKMALIQLHEAYNYFSCAQTEPDSRIRDIWNMLASHEVQHFMIVNGLLQKFEDRDIMDVLKTDTIEPLIVFEPNKEYVRQIVETQVNLQPLNMEFVDPSQLPADWASFAYRDKVNAGGAPSDLVTEEAQREARVPASI